jgi:type VII secretion protein EccB
MSSRRDQVDAQRYMLARVTGAMVRAEPETAESPTRRDRTGTIAGVVFAILLLGGTAIWALLPGSGSTRWQQPRMLIMDATTGARYIVVAGHLRPVNDIASATLLAGGRLTPVTVTSSQLSKVPRGEPVGTADRPQVLPSASQLNHGVWRACDAAGARIVLDVDVVAGPHPLAAGEALPVTAGGKTYLLWGGQRWLLTHPWVADALGLALMAPVPVGLDWLALLPLAGDAGPPTVSGAGQPGPAIAGQGTTIGQMLRVDMGNGSVSHYLVTGDGPVALTDTEYLLQRARPGSTGETVISPAALSASLPGTPARPLTRLPANPPQPRSAPNGARVCVEHTGRPDQVPTIGFAAAQPALSAGSSGNAPGVVVRVRPGGGALLVPPDAGADPLRSQALLVDERGVAYPVAAMDLTTLGYAVEQAVPMPPALIALLPRGPALARPEGG